MGWHSAPCFFYCRYSVLYDCAGSSINSKITSSCPVLSVKMASANFLMLKALLLVALMTVTTSGSSAVPTSNFIDTISGYSQLSTCAEGALSTIVRGQFSGCGDDGQLTSYTCFCTDSSSVISSVISTAVMTSCGSASASDQASSALSVFSGYCALGVEAGLKITSTAGE